MKRVSILCAFAAMSLASCTTTTGSVEPTPGTHQIPGHKWLTANDCVRKAPIGKFDAKCDIPVVGYRGADGLSFPGMSTGAPGGFTF